MKEQSERTTRISCPFADARSEGCICIALPDSKRISVDYQSRYCLTSNHVQCRRFQRAVPEIPEPRTSKVPAWVDDPRLVAVVAVLSVVLFFAIIATAVHGPWSDWFGGGGSNSPTAQSALIPRVTPTAIVLDGSNGATGSGAPSTIATQIPILQASPTATKSTAKATGSVVAETTPMEPSAISSTGNATPSATVSSEATPVSTEVAVGGAQSVDPITAPVLETPTIHTVQAGETLSLIGQAYGVSDELIAAANDLADADMIAQGEQLFIPTPDGHLPADAPMAAVHIVVPGDSISTIAPEFGVSVQTLMSFNNIANPDIIHVGDVIKIPKSALTASS